MPHETNLWSKVLHNLLGLSITFILKSNGLIFKKLIIAFTVIIDDLKLLLFRHTTLKPYIYGNLNMWLYIRSLVQRLIGILLVILSFLCCFAQALIFFVLSEYAIFYSLSTSGFKTEVSFDEEISFVRSEEKAFKSLNTSIVRRCSFFGLLEQNYQSFSKSSL